MIFKSIKTKFITVFGVLFLCLTLFSYIILQLVFTLLIENSLYNNVYTRQRDMDNEISSLFDEQIMLYSRITFDYTLSAIIDDNVPVETKKEMYCAMIENAGINRDIIYSVVCAIGGEIFYETSMPVPLPDSDFIKHVSSSENPIDQGKIITQNNESYIIIGKKMVNYPFVNAIGSIFFYIKTATINKICGVIEEKLGYSFIVSNNELIVSHKDAKKIGAIIYDAQTVFPSKLPGNKIVKTNGIKNIYIVSNLTQLKKRYTINWQVVSVILHNELFLELNNLKWYILMFSVACFGISLLVSLKLAKRLVNPLVSLSGRVKHFSKTGQKLKLGKTNDGNELQMLEKSYDDMIEKILDMIERIKDDMETQRKLELDSLQMQINPHFLYNVLDAIAWIAKLNKQEQIEKLTFALAKFFRISLHKGDKYIMVSEEIELIKNFMEIELIRFPNKFDVQFNIDSCLENKMCLKLVLQPLIENSIKHGVGKVNHRGEIVVNAYEENDEIVFEVIDNGNGFSSNNKNPQGGYGLKNVDERIKLAYGSNYGLSIDKSYKSGARVVLRMPQKLPEN